MLEGLIVFIITTILLMLTIAMFSLLYQRWNMQTFANDSAKKLAQTYAYSEPLSQADITTGEIDADRATKVRHYRYTWKKAEFEAYAKGRVGDFTFDRLRSSMLILLGSNTEITTEIKSDFLARRHVEVTITSTFVVPYQNVFIYMGLGDALTYQVTGYADCVDKFNCI
jgi:hypothetical protein